VISVLYVDVRTLHDPNGGVGGHVHGGVRAWRIAVETTPKTQAFGFQNCGNWIVWSFWGDFFYFRKCFSFACFFYHSRSLSNHSRWFKRLCLWFTLPHIPRWNYTPFFTIWNECVLECVNTPRLNRITIYICKKEDHKHFSFFRVKMIIWIMAGLLLIRSCKHRISLWNDWFNLFGRTAQSHPTVPKPKLLIVGTQIGFTTVKQQTSFILTRGMLKHRSLEKCNVQDSRVERFWTIFYCTCQSHN